MDRRLAQVPVVVELTTALGDAVQGVYVGGSVASGDYRPGVSDIDAVALVERPPDPAARRHITETHQRLGREVTGAAGLHCAYVSRGDGVDDLPAAIAEFGPGAGRRMGVLVDHLVPGTKESGIVDAVRALPGARGHVKVLGHPYVDVWQSVRPARLGLDAWPVVPRGQDWKHGICAALGWPHDSQADIALAWKRILGRVRSYADLEPTLLSSVEELIDFVTAPETP